MQRGGKIVLDENTSSSLENIIFNATISVKRAILPQSRLGRVFVDLVDEYNLTSADLSPDVEVIVQNDRQGREKFFDRPYHVVEHWFNSFPEDMLSGSDFPFFDIPQIKEVQTLRMATVWQAGNQSCPSLTNEGSLFYDCINKAFDIAEWYKEYFTGEGADELNRLDRLLKDRDQGPGRLYFELFWRYDVLVVPAKRVSAEKVRYGNVQRAVSQMRSGVPVLLEVYGEVLEDFVDRYNYKCCFRTRTEHRNTNISSRHFWSFEEASVAMKERKIRKWCQMEGLRIAREFSPGKLVARELKILGFDAPSRC